VSKLAGIAYFCKITVHQVDWFIEERNITYVDRRDQFELMKYLQMFEYSGVDTKRPYIHQSYR